MVAAAWGGARDADLTLFIVDARAGLTDPVRAIAGRLAKAPGRPVWLALNKVDLIPPPRLLPLAAEMNALVPVGETFMVSAEKGGGLDRLLERLAAAMPPGPWLFPEDELTDLPNRMLAAEIVREQVLRQTHEEVPHHATVETESWTERPDGSVRVDCTIYVGRASQRGIVIGDGGARIREIGRRARAELTRLLERPVHLFLNVKDRPGGPGIGLRPGGGRGGRAIMTRAARGPICRGWNGRPPPWCSAPARSARAARWWRC
jgi:GTP-binding protein Era